MTAAAPFRMEDYRGLALRTEAPITDKSNRQIVRSYEFFKDVLEECRDNAPMIDKLKRYGVYGKDDDSLVDQLMPTYPVGDKAERIRQCLRLLHGLIGVIGECGEMAEKVIGYIEGDLPELDVNNIEEEAGDALWFLNLIIAFCGPRDLVDLARRNLAKLKARFPGKFTLENYDNRDRATEMNSFNAE
jgi:NTP pyrophosphatase (non-canonical NTP hydrolase)